MKGAVYVALNGPNPVGANFKRKIYKWESQARAKLKKRKKIIPTSKESIQMNSKSKYQSFFSLELTIIEKYQFFVRNMAAMDQPWPNNREKYRKWEKRGIKKKIHHQEKLHIHRQKKITESD